MSTTGLNTEEEELKAFVRRYVALPAEPTADGAKAIARRKFYATVYGGEAVRTAKKATAQLHFEDYTEPAEAAEELLRRLRVARAEGTRRLWVRVYQSGDGGIVDSLEVAGDPHAPRQFDDAPEGGGAAAGLAQVAVAAMAELRHAYGLVVDGARDVVELSAARAGLERELEVRREVGFALGIGHAVDRATSNLAPHLGQVAEVIRAIRGLPAGGGAPGAASEPPAADHRAVVLARLDALERSANDLGIAVAAANAAGAVDDALRQELVTRLGALVAAFRPGGT